MTGLLLLLRAGRRALAVLLVAVALAVVVVPVLQWASLPAFPVLLPSPGGGGGSGVVVVLVTGCSSGIGYQTAMELDRLGYAVLAGVRKEEDLHRLEQLRSSSSSSQLRPLLLDVTNRTHIDEAYALVERGLQTGEFHHFAGVVNNAGVSLAWPLETTDEARMKELFDIDLFAPLHITRKFLPLIRQHHGRVVFISSVSDRFTTPFLTAYSMAKAGVRVMADGLRRELLGQNISVSTVSPGVVATSIVKNMKIVKVTHENAGPYYEAATSVEDMMQFTHFQRRGIMPSEVSRVIVDALQSEYPRPRYVVGADAWIVDCLQSLFPDALVDRAVETAMRHGPGVLRFFGLI